MVLRAGAGQVPQAGFGDGGAGDAGGVLGDGGRVAAVDIQVAPGRMGEVLQQSALRVGGAAEIDGLVGKVAEHCPPSPAQAVGQGQVNNFQVGRLAQVLGFVHNEGVKLGAGAPQSAAGVFGIDRLVQLLFARGVGAGRRKIPAHGALGDNGMQARPESAGQQAGSAAGLLGQPVSQQAVVAEQPDAMAGGGGAAGAFQGEHGLAGAGGAFEEAAVIVPRQVQGGVLLLGKADQLRVDNVQLRADGGHQFQRKVGGEIAAEAVDNGGGEGGPGGAAAGNRAHPQGDGQ